MLEKTIKIAPSILSADFSRFGEEIKDVERCGADLIHLDVMDGVFVNNITFGIKTVADIRPLTKLVLDTHLMIVNPEKYVERFAKAGSDIITVHYEACKDNLMEVVKLIKSCGVGVGVAINPDTPVELVKNVIPECDLFLVMSVFPGFGGQKLIYDVLPKIKQVREIAESVGKKVMIEVDGGINTETYKDVINAGADIIVAGSAVFGAKDRKQAISTLKG